MSTLASSKQVFIETLFSTSNVINVVIDNLSSSSKQIFSTKAIKVLQIFIKKSEHFAKIILSQLSNTESQLGCQELLH